MPGKLSAAADRVIVVGGSEGAIETLIEIAKRLPPRFRSPIFVVIHQPTTADSYLPKILSRKGPIPAVHPRDGAEITAGRIYVAPPDCHLTLESRKIRIKRGPRENRHRPAIDPLFRTAARSFGSNLIGVLLSGNLDDGSAGLLAVRRRGGIAIVENPATALVSEMPRRAIEYAGADFVLSATEIAAKLIGLIRNNRTRKPMKVKENSGSESEEIRQHEHNSNSNEGNGKPSVFACPECHGVLWEVRDGRLLKFRCRVGHAYSANSLKGELDLSAERAMWAAMRALEEKAAMTRRLLASMKGPKSYLQRLQEQADADAHSAHVTRDLIFPGE